MGGGDPDHQSNIASAVAGPPAHDAARSFERHLTDTLRSMNKFTVRSMFK
jgi:hypothetical protein